MQSSAVHQNLQACCELLSRLATKHSELTGFRKGKTYYGTKSDPCKIKICQGSCIFSNFPVVPLFSDHWWNAFAEWVSCLVSPLCKIYLLNRVNRKKFLLPIPSSIHRIICFIDKNSLVAPNKKIKESTFVEDKHPFFSVWPIVVTLRSTVIKVDLNIGHTLQ